MVPSMPLRVLLFVALAAAAALAIPAPARASIGDVAFRNGADRCQLLSVIPSRHRPAAIVPGRTFVFRRVGGTRVELTAVVSGGKQTCSLPGRGEKLARATLVDSGLAPHDYDATVQGGAIHVRKRS